ncbi:unnamed protein product [Onchocerca flexuosa]|uniref:Glutamic acid-rich protein-like n=1 Tax=Onchocerca flexuosa TaxID=387005 RepID=A0A183I1R3_9BILA|nr:unnamed protein product [Onchocerca flexuosa]
MSKASLYESSLSSATPKALFFRCFEKDASCVARVGKTIVGADVVEEGLLVAESDGFRSFVRLLLSSTITNISFSLEKSLVHAAGQYSRRQQHNSFVEFDGDENFDFDGDIDDDADEMAIHNRRAEKDTTPSREYISRSKTVEENRKAHQAIQDVPDSSILNCIYVNVVEQADLPSRTKGRHMEEEDKTSRKQNKEKDKPKRAKGHRKRIKVMEDDEEEEERTMAQKVELEKEEEQEETDGRNVQIEDSIEHEEKKSAVVNEGKESEHEYDTEKPKLKSRRKIPSFNMEKSKRECKRKNCLPEYDHHPRMSLLKEVPFSVKNRNKQQSIAGSKSIENDEKEEEITDTDDEWENEGIENKELDDESIRDLAAIKKEKSNDRTIYKRHAITNRDDHKYRNQLDRADYLVEKVSKKDKRELE